MQVGPAGAIDVEVIGVNATSKTPTTATNTHKKRDPLLARIWRIVAPEDIKFQLLLVKGHSELVFWDGDKKRAANAHDRLWFNGVVGARLHRERHCVC